MSIGVLINHTISFLTSPIAVSLALIVLGVVMSIWRRRSDKRVNNSIIPHSSFLIPHFIIAAGVLWLWFMSSGLAYHWLGMGLERDFPPVRVEELPKVDAVVVLGGGVGANTNTTYYTELYMGADRVAHAARIWKAGKAPVIITSGSGEYNASRPFLKELGVPESAILVENTSGNTEENAKFVQKVVSGQSLGDKSLVVSGQLLGACTKNSQLTTNNSRPKVLLVTSAWHMRRALLLFRRYAPDFDVIPAACDYEATIGSDDFNFWSSLLPNADALLRNSYMLKEYISYYGYKYLRR